MCIKEAKNVSAAGFFLSWMGLAGAVSLIVIGKIFMATAPSLGTGFIVSGAILTVPGVIGAVAMFRAENFKKIDEALRNQATSNFAKSNSDL